MMNKAQHPRYKYLTQSELISLTTPPTKISLPTHDAIKKQDRRILSAMTPTFDPEAKAGAR